VSAENEEARRALSELSAARDALDATVGELEETVVQALQV